MLAHHILEWLLLYKYVALFAIAFSSSLGVPVPAAWSTIAGAALASQGYLNISLVLLAGLSGNILGDLTAYGVVRTYGKPILAWFRLGKAVESHIIKRVQVVKVPYKATAIIASRFQDQTTTIVNIIAGLGGVDFKRFVGYAVIGDISQIAFYGAIGYFFADRWQSVYEAVGVFSWLIVILVASIALIGSRKIIQRIFR